MSLRDELKLQLNKANDAAVNKAADAAAFSAVVGTVLDFDSDEPLQCPMRDQSSDKPCDSCQ